MKSIADVRNFVLLGHTGSGKTALVEALVKKLGGSDIGSGFADWTDEEKERKATIWAKPFDLTYSSNSANKDIRMVFVDTPGYFDFYGQTLAAAHVADAALIVVDAVAGIQVGTTKAWRLCEQLRLPRSIVITGLDKEKADFDSVLESLQEVWGKRCVPAVIPHPGLKGLEDIFTVKNADTEALKNRFTEIAAETDDRLIEKYLSGQALGPEEISAGIHKSVNSCALVPVFAVDAKDNVGITELLENIVRFFPSPVDRIAQDNKGAPVDPSPAAPLVAFVWRSVNDPFSGQQNYVRIYGGKLTSDSEIYNATRNQRERIGTFCLVHGKKQEIIHEAHAGDIVAIPKLKHTHTNDTLCLAAHPQILAPIEFPKPVVFCAITPKTDGDDDKIGVGLSRLAEEDPTLHVERNPETHELILAALGDAHVDMAIKRLRNRSHVDVILSVPKVSYKETVTSCGDGHYKHKKQSGGRGQYGEVYLRVEPLAGAEKEDDWFVDSLVGGSIPGNFVPAVQKGVLEGMARGAIASYPVVGVKVDVYDGSYHDVDSSEIAFKIAAARAFRDGMNKAKPVLLEPIMTVKVMVPEQFMGEVTGDLNHRRGRILGMGSEDGLQIVTAEVPQAEIFQYSSQLRSLTGGRGSFELAFSRYDVVPANIAQKVVAASHKGEEEEE